MSYKPNVLDRYNEVRASQAGVLPHIIEKTVAASQTIKRGDLLTISAGKVQQAIAAPGVGSVTLSGGNLAANLVADADITTDSAGNETKGGVTRTTIPCIVLDGNAEYLCRLYAASATDAELQDITFGTAYQYGRYTKATGDSFYVLSLTTTNGEFKAVEALPAANYAATDQYPVIASRTILSETVRQV